MIKLNLPVTTARVGMAFNMPINSAVDRVIESARELDKAAEKMRDTREDFADKLVQAVKARLGARSRHTLAAASAEAEGFGAKLKTAIQKKLGQRQYRKG
jgi:hypothetical protein